MSEEQDPNIDVVLMPSAVVGPEAEKKKLQERRRSAMQAIVSRTMLKDDYRISSAHVGENGDLYVSGTHETNSNNPPKPFGLTIPKNQLEQAIRDTTPQEEDENNLVSEQEDNF